MADERDGERSEDRDVPATPAEGKPPERPTRPRKTGRRGYLEDFLPAD
jgi:hypothetical protein